MFDITVHEAEKADVKELAHTLSRAFFDDPVMSWLLPDAGRRAKALPKLFAIMARHQFLGGGAEIATDGANVAAAALWAAPGRWPVPRLTEWRMMLGLVRALGSDGKRGQVLDGLMKEHHPEEPHWYLAVIGSDPTYRGQGFGNALMSARLEQVDDEHAPAYLESSKYDNIAYYERFGFDVIGEIELPDGPTMWPMWRQPR